MSLELSTIVHHLVMDSPIPAKELARAINKPYPTLLREANPHDKGAKLSVETLFQLMLFTGNLKPLDYMANKLGFTLVPSASLHTPQVEPNSFQLNQEPVSPFTIVCPSCGCTMSYKGQVAYLPPQHTISNGI